MKPPVIEREPVARARREFARRAAMVSLAAPFLALGMNLVLTLIGRSRPMLLTAALLTVALIVSGVVLGIVALMENRKYPAEGVLPRAVGGICISGFLLLLMASGVPGLLRALQQGNQSQSPPANQPATTR